MCHILHIRSSINGHMDCFLPSAIMNNAAMNMGVQTCVHDPAFNTLGHIYALCFYPSNFTGAQPHPFTDPLPMATIILRWQNCGVATETLWFPGLKHFTRGLYRKSLPTYDLEHSPLGVFWESSKGSDDEHGFSIGGGPPGHMPRGSA